MDLILERLDSEPLDTGPASLLLAACESAAALDQAVGGTPAELPVRSVTPGSGTEPAGAWLSSLSVQGFRGVGPECTLPVEPGPGLTLVVGRNGSGKSSFAEGLEVLLTGGLRRWADRSAVWKESWRNLHHGQDTWVAADLLNSDGATHLERKWEPGGDLDSSAATMQVHGQKRRDLRDLGWDQALRDYRPLLSHSELEAFFSGKPSDLFELLSQVLGLDELVETGTRLTEARKQAEAHSTQAKKAVPGLLTQLEQIEDERAGPVRTALSSKVWDLEAVEAALTGSPAGGVDSELVWLKRVAQLSGPDPARCTEAAEELRTAADLVEAVEASEAGQARQLADLLEAALEHVRDAERSDCPVCGTSDVLDGSWQSLAHDRVRQLRQEAQEATEAQRKAADARRAANSLVTAPPSALTDPASPRLEVSEALEEWERWAHPPGVEEPAGLRGLAEHLESGAAQLAELVASLAAEASRELQAIEDHWAPVATALASWVAGARRGRDAVAAAKELKAAENWLKSANDSIRNARLAPITDAAREVWAQLRQESNVDLGEIRLAGTGTKRHLQIEVKVDGSEGAALGVMSQGEVNALALSIFLPRATLAASPFRFLVIDDPVQAMDPAKVDGFARVIQRFAEKRQVIVFTHDDRLPDAVRRLDIAATTLEVTRQSESVVEVRAIGNPARRALDDAGALCADDSVPHKVAARVIPNLCRIAAESALINQARRRLLAAGMPYNELEQILGDAKGLTSIAALGFFGDVSKGGDVLPRLNRMGRDLADTFQSLNKGAHFEHPGDLRDLVGAAKKLVHEIDVSGA